MFSSLNKSVDLCHSGSRLAENGIKTLNTRDNVSLIQDAKVRILYLQNTNSIMKGLSVHWLLILEIVYNIK